MSVLSPLPKSALLHTCCAPCAIACIDSLREESFSLTGFWFNPNIHPFTEYRLRKNTLAEYAETIHLPMIWQGDYGLRPFVQATASDINARCSYCYDVRMEAVAQAAAENGFSHFTTTLFISPYQNHELLRQSAEKAAERHGVSFLYRDFRPLFRQGQQKARELALYMQKYCGCIFSEEDRYQKKSEKTKKL